MFEGVASQTTVAIFSRPFSETYSSSVRSEEAIPDELRSIPGVAAAPTEIKKYAGDAASQAWFWTERWQAGEREAQEDIAAGRGDFYVGSDAFLESL